MSSEKSNPVPRCVDVLVVCALDVELKALRKAFGPSVIEDAADARIRSAVEEFYATAGELNVLCVKIPFPGAGNVTSGVVTASLLPLVAPWLVISFGLAGTFDEEEVPKRAAVFSRSVSYIDLRKETAAGGRIGKSVATLTTASDLLSILSDLGGLQADVVSSEAVVKADDAQVRDAAARAVADAKVVEMEAFGVFQACEIDRRLNQTKRYCVAIKAISDHADITKDNAHHTPAAEEATKLVIALLKDRRTIELKENSSLYAQPLPFRPFSITKQADVLAAEFIRIARPALRAEVDGEVVHGVHLRTRRPRIFYHWRLTANGLHWVELHFLRVLRQLGRIGYPIECLVADQISEDLGHNTLHTQADLERARASVDRVLRGLFQGVNCRVAYLSDVKKLESQLQHFSTQSGCGHAFVEKLSTAPGSTPALNSEFDLWLRYIAWRCQVDGTCLILHHPGRSMIYSLLWHFADLVPGLLSTPTINLGSTQGKTHSPGKDLFLLPPMHPDIRVFLQEKDDPDLLRQLWTYITETPIVEERFILERKQWAISHPRWLEPIRPESRWLEAFQRGTPDTPDYYKGAIAVELAHWNEVLSDATAVRYDS